MIPPYGAMLHTEDLKQRQGGSPVGKEVTRPCLFPYSIQEERWNEQSY